MTKECSGEGNAKEHGELEKNVAEMIGAGYQLSQIWDMLKADGFTDAQIKRAMAPFDTAEKE